MVKIKADSSKIQAISPNYTWEWNADTDIFCLYDIKTRLISRARHCPLLVTSPTQSDFSTPTYQVDDNRISLT
jgi:hypothetical protein